MEEANELVRFWSGCFRWLVSIIAPIVVSIRARDCISVNSIGSPTVTGVVRAACSRNNRSIDLYFTSLQRESFQGHELDFDGASPTWAGASATVVPRPDSHVWGAVWEMLEEDKEHLDEQEGVSSGVYDPFEVVVESPTKGILTCRTYKLHKQPERLQPGQARPADRVASRIYLEVILQGAVESGLPKDYFNTLKKFPHNGSSGGPGVPLQIEYKYTKELNEKK